jgi:hypothetical protein
MVSPSGEVAAGVLLNKPLDTGQGLLGPKNIAEMINARDGAVREMLSQMVKDGQVKNLGHGQYVHPNNQELC